MKSTEKVIPREEPIEQAPNLERSKSDTREIVRESASVLLRRVLRGASSGEIAVENGKEVARIHVDGGRLAWIHRSHQPVSVRALVEDCGSVIDDETLRRLLEESRSSRRHFGDVLVHWGIVDKQRLREALRRKVRADLGEILAWPHANATFVRGKSTLSSELAFDEDELPLSTPTPGRVETLTGIPAVRASEPIDESDLGVWLDRVRAIEHVVGCAILDPKRRLLLAQRDMDERLTAVAWGLAGGFIALGDDADEILATAKRTTVLVRAAPFPGRSIAVVCFDSTGLSPAMARILVGKVV